jgi:FkbM family methyltransferase
MNSPTGNTSLPKACLRFLVDLALLSRSTKLPPYFNLRHRLSYIFNGLEPSIVRVASEILRPSATVVDIGANVGFLTRQFAAMVGKKGRVFAFEPDPATFAYLTYNTRNLSQVICSTAALSDRDGNMTLHLHPTSAMSNSLVNAWDNAQQIDVTTCAFDTWAEANNVGDIGLIKIDVEGAEPLVLRGMHRTLSSSHKPPIISEFCPANLRGRAAEEEIFQLFMDNGYKMHLISSRGTLHCVKAPADVYTELNENGYVNLLAHTGNI